MKRYCFACDLKDESELIKKYKEHHQKKNIWPEITASIKDAGIMSMEIFLTGNRLFMIMQTEDHFTLDKKAEMDLQNPKVQEWEELMWSFQQALPWATEGQKWVLLEKIYTLA